MLQRLVRTLWLTSVISIFVLFFETDFWKGYLCDDEKDKNGLAESPFCANRNYIGDDYVLHKRDKTVEVPPTN